MKKILYCFLFFCGLNAHAQIDSVAVEIKTFNLTSNTVQIDSLSISPYYFKVFDINYKLIPKEYYSIDFAKAQLKIDNTKYRQIQVHYKSLPNFLTKTYRVFDEKLIVPRITDLSRMYSAQEKKKNENYRPFDGLNTSGNIARGLTIGNNQDAVVNSNFDLQISGALSKNVKIRGSITDSNIPLQENGYTQRLEEFDRVFVELSADQWRVQAGDLNLKNTNSKFLRFNKKVAGLWVEAEDKNDKWGYFASGAIVRGQFARNQFNGQEANQGPYKINNSSLEQFILIISGSESVFVNGQLLKRGENNDYVIDYNTAEISFMPTFPVTANMRIIVEYQYSERNYSRFVTYNGLSYSDEKFNLGLDFYNENDLKNSTVQLDLNDSQKQILSDAGDDQTAMLIPSAIPSIFDDRSILYKKEIVNGIEAFIYSVDPGDDLFKVKFNYIGQGLGSYSIQTTIAAGRIYEYAGLGNGDYEPVIQLVAPNKLQILNITAGYSLGEKTQIDSEFALSNHDQNLFSSLDDDDNQGIATQINWKQTFIDRDWKLKSNLGFEWIATEFKPIERIQSVEFQRDWNLINPTGNQQKLSGNISLIKDSIGFFTYQYDQLKFGNNFNGQKHGLSSKFKIGAWNLNAKAETLNADGVLQKSYFNRWDSHINRTFKKLRIGTKFNGEHRVRENVTSNTIDPLSHRYLEAIGYFGIGDSTKTNMEIGYIYSHTDSLKTTQMTRVNNANTIYLKSQLIQKDHSNLSVFLSYRTLKHQFSKDEESLNTRIIYRQQLAKNAVNFQTVYETSSGALPQQEYNYIEVDTGQGYYAWIDYNENGIQELDEFEQAQFQDQANYLRVLLPTLRFLRTNQNKFSQSITLQALNWQQKTRFKKVLSKFVNQSIIVLNSKQLREDKFALNPFKINGNNVLALNTQYKNSLYFNRGKQHFSSTYIYLKTQQKSSFSIGDQDHNLRQHQFNFEHKIGNFWLLGGQYSLGKNSSISNRFSSRNYNLDEVKAKPTLAYVFAKQSRIEGFYAFNSKKNTINDFEEYKNHTLGIEFRFAKNRKFSTFGKLQYIENTFDGNANSPVSYQMLEGLRPGTNFTWNFGFQKRISSYLDLNLSYFGRKSASANAIHTGSMQLRANF